MCGLSTESMKTFNDLARRSVGFEKLHFGSLGHPY
jgi:hypothetical protein